WDDFWRILQQTRKAGYYLSRGELESEFGSIGVPFFGESSQAIGSLALVVPVRRLDFMNHEKLLVLLLKAAAALKANVHDRPPATPVRARLARPLAGRVTGARCQGRCHSP